MHAKRPPYPLPPTPYSLLIIFIIYIFFNVLFSASPLLGFYGLAKLLEFLFLGTYIARNIKTKKELSTIAFIFSFSVIGESLLSIAQYIHQGSLNGVLYFLGERKFTPSTPGIANASINGQLILRPYGTFSHPNVLAGFLLCSLTLIFQLLETNKNKFKKLLKSSTLLLGSIALFLSLSRVAIIIWIFLVIILLINKFRTQSRAIPATAGIFSIKIPRPLLISTFFLITITTALLLSTPILPRLISSNFSESSFTQRIELLKSSVTIIQSHPLFGVGLDNFIPASSLISKPLSPILYLQPVHNIFLLIAAETGLIGLIFISLFLFKTCKRLYAKRNEASIIFLIILSTIIILGQFDHYWLTLQQGQLLISLVLGLCWTVL